MRFNVNDEVIVCDGSSMEDPDYISWVNSMSRYVGRKATIVRAYSKSYRLDIDNQIFAWADYWLEPAVELPSIEESDFMAVLGGDM